MKQNLSGTFSHSPLKHFPPCACGSVFYYSAYYEEISSNQFHIITPYLYPLKTSEKQRFSLSPMDVYVCQRQLPWAGHVMRMPWDCLPRKMILFWVRSKQPKGCANVTYGRYLKSFLKKADVDIEKWNVLSLDHDGCERCY